MLSTADPGMSTPASDTLRLIGFLELVHDLVGKHLGAEFL